MFRVAPVRFASILLSISLWLAACGSSSVATLDGTAISETALSDLHVDVSRLKEDELVSSILLLLLHNAFIARADRDFAVSLDDAMVESFYAGRTERWRTPDEVELGLAARNERPSRVRLESELDTVRDEVSAHLVRSESPGFDLAKAYNAYLIDNARVCVLQIQLESPGQYDETKARLDAGEAFADVALDVSLDPFVGREDGGVGTGGDIGCSAPAALPTGMDAAVLVAPIGEAYGPITSNIGVHLVWVVERDAPALDEVRPAVIEHAVTRQGPDLFRVWAVEVLQTMDVEIADQYGVWGMLPETDPVPTVVPPARVDQIVGGASLGD